MNECRFVADRIREVGRCDRQELGKPEKGKRIFNEAPAHLISSYEGTPPSRNRPALPEQDPDHHSLSESTCPLGGARPGERNSADRTSTLSIAPEDQTKQLKRRGEGQSSQTRNDGRKDNSNSQRTLLPEALEEGKAQPDWRSTERPASKNQSLHVPQNPSPLLSCSEILSEVIRKGPGPTVPSAEAKEASGAKEIRKKQAAPPVRDPPIPSLNVLPGSGSGPSFPPGEDTQGPSPVDYTLHIEAAFPPNMVLDMKKCAAQRARKTVIGRTLGGKASHKDLADCLKLHLPASFTTITLLTRGYFEILFKDEEGAKATRKLTAVEWSGWALSFSKYSEYFRSNEPGAEKLLTHSIKVQFPDLHAQFRTIQALTIMASSIGEVLDIESPDSYIKRPAGPMVTVEVRDISRLAGIVRIPSMSEGTEADETIAQRIIYSGLSNQYRKCRRFGHLARACPQNKPPTQGGNTSTKPPPLKGSWKSAPRKVPGAQSWRQTTANTAKRADFIQRLELELEENILRFKWCIKDQPHLEWSWQEEKNRGGMDCTIVVHIDTGTSALSTQNKRHLHWKVLDPTQEMNNDMEFSTSAHNLLRKTDTGNSTSQAHRNKSASLLASPQAARKKRFTKLDLALMTARLLGSIGPPAARNKLTYD
ncbi:unnamed protein product [Sphagnum tenellum]